MIVEPHEPDGAKGIGFEKWLKAISENSGADRCHAFTESIDALSTTLVEFELLVHHPKGERNWFCHANLPVMEKKASRDSVEHYFDAILIDGQAEGFGK